MDELQAYARRRIGRALDALDGCWYELYRAASRRIGADGGPVPKPMEAMGEIDRAEAEWALLVAKLRSGGGEAGPLS
ncbi:hypothetical protein B7C62_12890 [Kitasatospora albolonga]|uniref:Uncharacterized protein n=1 Tax=Kitasatospora albolonga TaxID=68173 RepID=A0ABC8BSF1_9ACTN|nr:hypothetical protein B7C62_12890 [Kitasatospora albolonga]